ncbi:shikimate kinase [Niallia endozanthoxylica]|uniref:Shikimate kinase n=1 Tax=Niallia endozanthoxylica TaxID=2036016 RepID=A0A5J5HIA2_9BACI|nr:shikimate kinase [Niallia endozanthoxylica]KAA9019927.1 shikimate kinase [Niallia endozanthoxylica]
MSHRLSLREKSIVFVGFMGVGKTTIGKLVAKKLYRDFIDVDEEIEKEFGMPPRQIFETYGEKTFREREQSLTISLSKQPLNVISLGGGAFLNEEIRKACLENCIVFFLDLSWDSWKERISLIIDSRPVLQNKSLEEMKELYYSRQSAYSHHHSKLQTDHMNEEEAAEYLIESLKLTWELYA